MQLVASLTNMNVFKRIAASSNIRSLSARQILACLLALSLLLPVLPQTVSAAQDDAQAQAQPSQAPPYTQQTPEQLQQLVAPHRALPRFARGAGSRGVYFSRRDRRSRPLGAIQSRSATMFSMTSTVPVLATLSTFSFPSLQNIS